MDSSTSSYVDIDAYELIFHESVEIFISHRFNPSKRHSFRTSNTSRQTSLSDIITFIHQAFHIPCDRVIRLIIVRGGSQENPVYDINQLFDMTDVVNERISFNVEDYIELRLIPDQLLSSEKVSTIFLPTRRNAHHYTMQEIMSEIKSTLGIGSAVNISVSCDRVLLEESMIPRVVHHGRTIEVWVGDNIRLSFEAIYFGKRYAINTTTLRDGFLDIRGFADVTRAIRSILDLKLLTVNIFNVTDGSASKSYADSSTTQSRSSEAAGSALADFMRTGKLVLPSSSESSLKASTICGMRSRRCFDEKMTLEAQSVQSLKQLSSIVYIAPKGYKNLVIEVSTSSDPSTRSQAPNQYPVAVLANSNWDECLRQIFRSMVSILSLAPSSSCWESFVSAIDIKIEQDPTTSAGMKLTDQVLSSTIITRALSPEECVFISSVHENPSQVAYHVASDESRYDLVLLELDSLALHDLPATIAAVPSTLIDDYNNLEAEAVYRIILVKRSLATTTPMPTNLQRDLSDNSEDASHTGTLMSESLSEVSSSLPSMVGGSSVFPLDLIGINKIAQTIGEVSITSDTTTIDTPAATSAVAPAAAPVEDAEDDDPVDEDEGEMFASARSSARSSATVPPAATSSHPAGSSSISITDEAVVYTEEEYIICQSCHEAKALDQAFYMGCACAHVFCYDCIVQAILPEITGSNDPLPRHPHCQIDHPICYECIDHQQVSHRSSQQCFACSAMGLAETDSSETCQTCYNHHHVYETIENSAGYPYPVIPSCLLADRIPQPRLSSLLSSNSIDQQQLQQAADMLTCCNYSLTKEEVNSVLDIAFANNRLSAVKTKHLQEIVNGLYASRSARAGLLGSWYQDESTIHLNESFVCPCCGSELVLPCSVNILTGTESSSSSTSARCSHCDMSFCKSCGSWPYHNHLSCDELIATARAYRDFMVEGRLKYLLDLSKNGRPEQRMRAEEWLDLVKRSSAVDDKPTVQLYANQNPYEAFVYLNRIAVSPFVSLPPPTIHGWANMMETVVEDTTISSRSLARCHPYRSMGAADVIAIDTYYKNLCQIERLLAASCKRCPSCHVAVKKLYHSDRVICGFIDPLMSTSQAGPDHPIRGCGHSFSFSTQGLPYIPNTGEHITAEEESLYVMKLDHMANYTPDHPVEGWEELSVGAVLADGKEHPISTETPEYCYTCDCPNHNDRGRKEIIGPMLTCIHCPRDYRICLKCSLTTSHFALHEYHGKTIRIPHIFKISY
jgi:hypothetical protein